MFVLKKKHIIPELNGLYSQIMLKSVKYLYNWQNVIYNISVILYKGRKEIIYEQKVCIPF